MKPKSSYSILKLIMRSVLLLLLGVGLNHAASAQNFVGKIILGMNGSQIDGDGLSGYYKAGLVAGGGVRFPVTDKLSIGPEILYSMKGAKTSFDQVTKFGYDITIYRLNYVDMPIVAEYKIDRGPEIEGGVIVSYLLNAKLEVGRTNQGFLPVDYLFKKMDYQGFLGLKYEIFDDCWLSGRIAYSMISTNAIGLTNPNYPIVGVRTRGGFFNNYLQFTLSYKLFGSDSKKDKE